MYFLKLFLDISASAFVLSIAILSSYFRTSTGKCTVVDFFIISSASASEKAPLFSSYFSAFTMLFMYFLNSSFVLYPPCEHSLATSSVSSFARRIFETERETFVPSFKVAFVLYPFCFLRRERLRLCGIYLSSVSSITNDHEALPSLEESFTSTMSPSSISLSSDTSSVQPFLRRKSLTFSSTSSSDG